MTGLDYAALGLIGFLACIAIGAFVALATWPGRAAAARGHPYRTAVTVGGWITLVCGGVFFPLVVVWAYAGAPDGEAEAAP